MLSTVGGQDKENHDDRQLQHSDSFAARGGCYGMNPRSQWNIPIYRFELD